MKVHRVWPDTRREPTHETKINPQINASNIAAKANCILEGNVLRKHKDFYENLDLIEEY